MEFNRRQFWCFVGAILVSSALIAWSLVSLYGPLEYQDDYLEEDYEPLDDEVEQETPPDAVTMSRDGATGSTPDARSKSPQ